MIIERLETVPLCRKPRRVLTPDCWANRLASPPGAGDRPGAAGSAGSQHSAPALPLALSPRQGQDLARHRPAGHRHPAVPGAGSQSRQPGPHPLTAAIRGSANPSSGTTREADRSRSQELLTWLLSVCTEVFLNALDPLPRRYIGISEARLVAHFERFYEKLRCLQLRFYV